MLFFFWLEEATQGELIVTINTGRNYCWHVKQVQVSNWDLLRMEKKDCGTDRENLIWQKPSIYGSTSSFSPHWLDQNLQCCFKRQLLVHCQYLKSILATTKIVFNVTTNVIFTNQDVGSKRCGSYRAIDELVLMNYHFDNFFYDNCFILQLM